MRFLARVAALFYVVLTLFIGCFILSYLTGYITLSNVKDAFYLINHDDQLMLVVFTLTTIFMLLTIIFYRVFLSTIQMDRLIAFDNPAGRVSVSLFALEDLIRRLLSRLQEVKDSNIRISASRRGLQIKVKLILSSEFNIPDTTAKVQNLIKKKIHDTIGIEEAVNVSVFIGKILTDKNRVKTKKVKKEVEETHEPNIPFQGYRA